jgi:hypothetical protein
VIKKAATVSCYRNIKLTIVLKASIIGILISSYPAFSSSVSLTPEEQQWLSEHKTIRVSGPQAFPPFQFFNEEDEYVGRWLENEVRPLLTRCQYCNVIS